MTSDPSSAGHSSQGEPRMPQLPGPIDPVQSVPTYNLEIYVRNDSETGLATARLANLAIPDVQASSPRDALRKIAEEGKKVVRDAAARCHPIPWIEPPLAIEPGENRFLVAMHL